ncbi:MAG TPA: hypothetical protein VMG31_02840 [Verrucomicrobiae bacterium]|nr:hypothetical protein [Verrucomicrobiae bacterium]
MKPENFQQLESLAAANHVVLRALEPIAGTMIALGNDRAAEQALAATVREKARIDHALGFLEQICSSLQKAGYPVVVIKSLDHWPDLGSDLDLYSDADAAGVIAHLCARFKARLMPRSWGDRLAHKWNCAIPGLPELVELHAGRLGQMGEQDSALRSLSLRSRNAQLGAHFFRVPAPEDRIILSTLQRMYRHFYIRLCDIVDIGQLLASAAVDFRHLRSISSDAGLWEGVATYLRVIGEYIESYDGNGVELPSFVFAAARFGVEQIRYAPAFLRVPIVPHSAGLYFSELKQLLQRGDLRNTFRLGLLPCLATAALVEQKLTGSDKGVW